MSYDTESLASFADDTMSETSSTSSNGGELLPEIQAAISNALRDFGDTYDLSTQPELILNLYNCLDKALKAAGLPFLICEGEKKDKRKGKVTAYTEFTKAAWARHKEEKKKAKKENNDSFNDGTPQELMSVFAKQWKALSAADKKPYEDLAAKHNNPNPTGTETPAKRKVTRRKGPLSGYQYFITLTKAPEDLSSTDQLRHKARLWAELSDEEKAKHKIEAEELFWKENPDLYQLNQQKIADDILREEQRKLQLQKITFNRPVLPTLIKRPVQTSDPVSVPTVTPKIPVVNRITNNKTVPETVTGVVTKVVVKPIKPQVSSPNGSN
jgi:hypothetical protein